MTNLLDLVDKLIGDRFLGNLYTDLEPYRTALGLSNPAAQIHQVPNGAFGHIPNTDPRLLNLQPPEGFEHPHDKISKETARRVIPPDVAPNKMHDTYQEFVLGVNQPISPQKRQEIYGPGKTPPPDITNQVDSIANNKPLSPSEIAHRMSRGEIYAAQPPASMGQPIPGGTISRPTYGINPPSIEQQVKQVELNQTPPPDEQIRKLNRSEIYKGVGPQSPADSAVNLGDNKSPPISPRDLSRGEIYGPGNTPPQSISKQSQNLSSDSIPPPGPTRGIEDTTIRKLNRGEVYGKSLAPQSSIQSLIDFHQSVQQPPTPEFTANKRQTASDFPPKTPLDAGPSQVVGDGKINEFANSPQRPLNFRDASDAPDRLDLVAKNHPQHMGWNASGQELPAQRRGTITDNRYDDTDIPFDGNFQSVFRGPVPQILNYVNFAATGHWLRNIAEEFFIPDPSTGGFPTGPQPSQSPDALAQPIPEGLTKGINFIATQFLLTAFNPANPENGGPGNAIWNPLSILASLPLVGSLPYTSITAGAALGLDYKSNTMELEALGGSRMQLMRKGLYSEVNPLHRLSKLYSPVAEPGFIGDLTSVGTEETLDRQQRDNIPLAGATVQTQVDGGALTELVASQGIHTNIYTSEDPYSVQTNLQNAVSPQQNVEDVLNTGLPGAQMGTEIKIRNTFDFKPFPGGNLLPSLNSKLLEDSAAKIGTWVVKPRALRDTGIEGGISSDAPGINAAIVDVKFPAENDEDLVTGQPIPDSDVYMPFSFQDLRDPTEQFLYFRAFLKGDINETFTPEWQTERFYGRVDMIPIYKGTVRTLNFSFDVAAFKPADLAPMWNKLKKLQSMVYPTYDVRGFMKAGPIIRMRIGDLFAGEDKRGLPGYITGMDWSFPDGIWNITENFKVPRLVTVSMSYVVIHDGNPGTYPLRQWDVGTDGEPTNITEGRTFGTGRIESQGDGSSRFKISEAEIRKIFSPNRNQN